MEHKNGFSLVELSIVLVILGLLTGGILGGQALIKAAEMRAVTTELNTWQTAVNTFKNKYMGIPGDLRNAGQFWGYVNTGGTNGNCSAPATNTGTGTQTCSGDGSGTVNLDYELFRFWEHLSNAGMIQGEYTGVAGSGSTLDSQIGVNIPTSKFGNGGWNVRSLPNNPGMDSFYLQFDYGNMYLIGANWTGTVAHAPLFTPEEAWNIDTKIDDGRPGTGTVISMIGGNCTSSTSRTATNTTYQLSQTGKNCALIFPKAF